MANRLKHILSFARDRLLRRRNSILAHESGFFPPKVASIIVADIPVSEADVAIAERLLVAYRRAVAGEELTNRSDVWAEIKKQQSQYIQILEKDDPRTLAAYLCNMNRHDATIGTVQGFSEYRRLVRSREYRNFIALQIKDKLISLAEAIGALSCENPEQGPWGESMYLDTDFLVMQIERILEMDIAPPPIDGGLLKIISSRGLFHERDLNAIYTAWILRHSTLSDDATLIAEIGAGAGRLAYWNMRFGARAYSIFDLPHINVIQGFYLQKALPAVPVSFYGEVSSEKGVTILPYYEIFRTNRNNFDLVINQDSFPEIDANTVKNYLERIRTISPRYFFSINHESRPRSKGDDRQISVPELIAQVGGFQRCQRQLYWLRKGYVFEAYEIARS